LGGAGGQVGEAGFDLVEAFGFHRVLGIQA
jgi:hypothetical protein